MGFARRPQSLRDAQARSPDRSPTVLGKASHRRRNPARANPARFSDDLPRRKRRARSQFLGANRVEYVAGVLVVHREGEQLMEYRSSSPILIPEIPEETLGTVDHVVFPTG